MIEKLKQRYKMELILKAIMRSMNRWRRKSRIIGIKIEISGRFSRRDRSTYHLIKKGKMPLNTKYSIIDYAIRLFPMRYSICVLKI
jgi:ribosomal protein S3